MKAHKCNGRVAVTRASATGIYRFQDAVCGVLRRQLCSLWYLECVEDKVTTRLALITSKTRLYQRGRGSFLCLFHKNKRGNSDSYSRWHISTPGSITVSRTWDNIIIWAWAMCSCLETGSWAWQQAEIHSLNRRGEGPKGFLLFLK